MIRVFEPQVTTKDKISVLKSLFQKNISGTSPIVKEFEEMTANKFNRKYSVSVSNGSVALDIALQSLNLKEGEEVILPSHTIISCLSAVVRTKATPIFCDVDDQTWNMTLSEVKKHVTKNTKAILMVHIFGLPSEAKQIDKFCKENGIYLIEDAAEAHGQQQMGKLCGSFGDISTFSFYANKHVTTGEGGMILTNDSKIYEKCKSLKNLCFGKNDRRFLNSDVGWNYRFTNIQASLGLSQLNRLKSIVNKKIFVGKTYYKYLKNNKNIYFPEPKKNNLENIYWVNGLLILNGAKKDAKKLAEELKKHKIETRPFFWPMHKQPILKKKISSNKNDKFPFSNILSKYGIYLPSSINLSYNKIRYISLIVNKLTNEKKN